MTIRQKYSLIVVLVGISIFTFIFLISGWSHSQYNYVKTLLPDNLEQKEQKLVLLISKDERRKQALLKLDVPENGIYLGVDTELPENGLRRFEALAGNQVAVINNYVYWGADNASFNNLLASRLWMDGKVLLITWNPSKSVLSNPINQPKFRLKLILQGHYDSYIKEWATQVKKWRRPIIIRFAPEMNGDWLPWGSDYTTPNEYKQTYRYVVDIFKKAKADNVSWMWSPNEAGDKELMDYYPGDDYVDWVGLSGFNWGGLKPYQSWRSIEEIFAKSFEQLSDINRPIALVELGTIENKSDPLAKPEWITNSFSQLEDDFPRVKMVVWYHGASFTTYDWRINTSVSSLEAFKEAISHRYFIKEVQVKGDSL